MKLGSSPDMDTKRPRGSERSKPCHESQLTRRSQPPYPWPPEQAQPDVSKPCRTTTNIAGLHHVTAVAIDPQANIEFCTKVLGLRLIKETVNFDDPGAYHFYYGDNA